MYIYTQMHVHMHVHMHSRAHTHTGAHTHTYTYTHIQIEMYEARYKWAKTRKFASLPSVVCVECLIGKQKKPILFKVTEPSRYVSLVGLFCVYSRSLWPP
jgi:hypothetical protein